VMETLENLTHDKRSEIINSWLQKLPQEILNFVAEYVSIEIDFTILRSYAGYGKGVKPYSIVLASDATQKSLYHEIYHILKFAEEDKEACKFADKYVNKSLKEKSKEEG